MNSKRTTYVVVTGFVLLAGCFVLIAQDEPNIQSDNQKIDNLEQLVAELQNELQDLKTGGIEQIYKDTIATPQPVYDSGYRPQVNAPSPNSIYSGNPASRPMLPPPVSAPQYGYNQGPPTQPWQVEPPLYPVPTSAERYVPVPVPYVIEASPCYADYGPVFEPYFAPAIGQFSFWFGGGGHGHGH